MRVGPHVISIRQNSKVRSANARFLQLAAALVLIVILMAVWLVRDHTVLLADMHKLQTETLSNTITNQKVARNLDELRRQGERVLFAATPEERSQALLVVQLVASSSAFVTDVQVSALAGDTERFLKANEANSRLSESARTEWRELTQRLSLLASDISFKGLNLGTADLKEMQTLVSLNQMKLLAALLVLTFLMLGTLFLIRRDFIDPLRRIHTAIDQIDKDTEPQSAAHSDIVEIQAIESSIGAQCLAQRSLRESEARFRTVFEMSLDGIVLHRDGKFLYVNPAAIAIFGARSEQELLDTPVLAVIHPDFHNIVAQRMKASTEQGIAATRLEEKYIKLDGTVFDVEVQVQSIVLSGRLAFLATVRDITERKQSEAKLRIAASVFSHAREGISITDAGGSIIDVNESFSRITGYDRAEVLGQNSSILKSGRQDASFYAAMWSDLIAKGFWTGEIWNRRKDGQFYAEQLAIQALRDPQDAHQGYVALFTDISERKALEAQMHQMAYFDALTGLPNRRMLADRLGQAMAASKRSGLYGALMFLDLDNFKPLNDAYGHEVGDLLLIEVARRLTECLRKVDTVARFGGDEFVVMLSELDADKVQSTEQAAGVAEKIRASVAEPYFLNVTHPGQESRVVEHRCSTSMGVVLFVNHESNPADIMNPNFPLAPTSNGSH
jgi:diguanylate cyclase (GGDEF)-like protein/PAS domain S-box-containing protein